jgi:hypothetical protein
MAQRFFVSVGSVKVGSEDGYADLNDAKRVANRTPGAHIERVTAWGMANERSSIVKERAGDVIPARSSSAATALPALFQGLTARDWLKVREAVAVLGKGDEEALATSVGYVDVGRTDGGAVYVGGNSFDARGGGGLSYRKVYQMQWPRA